MNSENKIRHHLTKQTEVFNCRIFRTFENELIHVETQQTVQVYTLKFSDWVNVIPITPDGQIVLVKQHRFGTDTVTLETPGGAVDPHEKDLTLAALRELEEETGLSTNRILSLPGMHPNPAIQGNRITYFLALNVAPPESRQHFPDPFEKIEIVTMPIADALHAVRTGQINHALAALGILMAEPYLARFRA